MMLAHSWTKAVLRLFIAAALLAVLTPGAATAQTIPAYTLNPGDEIEVAVWKEPELQKLILVRPDGKFSFPLVGEVNGLGRNVAQIQQEIAEKLKVYIPEPVVSVTVTKVAGNRVYVLGQVNKPGTFDMNPRVTVLQALALAGGLTAFASGGDIKVIRKAATDAKQQVMPFDFGAVSKGRNLDQNVLLESGDVVVVP